MADASRRKRVREIPISEVTDLSRLLRDAAKEDILITRNGKPAGVVIGFASEDAWLDYQLENDPRFLERIERARAEMRAGRGIRLKIEPEERARPYPHAEEGDRRESRCQFRGPARRTRTSADPAR